MEPLEHARGREQPSNFQPEEQVDESKAEDIAKEAGIVPEGKKASLERNVSRSQIAPHQEHDESNFFTRMISNVKSAVRDFSVRIGIRSNKEITVSDKGITEFSRLNKIDREFQKFTDFFASKLMNRLSSHFFPIEFKNKSNKHLKAKYDGLDRELQYLKGAKYELNEKISDLQRRWDEGDTNAEIEIGNLQSEVDNLDKKIIDLEVKTVSGDEIRDKLKAVREERKGLSSKNRDDIPKIRANREEKQRLVALRAARKNLPKDMRDKIDLERSRVAKYEFLSKKGDETRARLTKLGGEQISLTTKDGAKLDGVFMDASKFREKLAAHGGEVVTFTGKDGTVLKGISFDREIWKESNNHIIDIMKDLNAIAFTNEMMSGWTPIFYQTENQPDRVVLVPTSSLPENENNKGLIRERGDAEGQKVKYKISNSHLSSEPAFEQINTKSDGGTVILSFGNAGVYEQYKHEAVSFLFQGMNCVLFNYRGNGKSEGVASDENYLEDIETVYKFTKKRTGDEDNKILFKGLCFGGGPSAHAAGKHPETNLFLEQTYSSFQSVVKDEAQEMLNEKIDDLREKWDPEEVSAFATRATNWLKANITPIIAKCVSLIAPDFRVSENLAKNKGHQALLYLHNDDVIPLSHVEANLRSAYNAGSSVQVIRAEGEHGNDWGDLTWLKGGLSEIDDITSEIDYRYEDLIEAQEKDLKIIENEIKANRKNKERLKELKEERAIVKHRIAELKKDNEAEIARVYEDRNMNQKQVEKMLEADVYHARNEMDIFLNNAGLADRLI